MHPTLRSLHLRLLLLSAAAVAARGDTTWTGTVNGDWNNASNWSAGIPLNNTAGNTLTIGANANLTMNQNLAAGNDITGLILNGTPASNVVIGGNQLDLHSGGINMTGAGVNLTFNNEVDVLAAQPWVIEGGRTLETADVDGGSVITLSRAGAGTATYRISGTSDNNSHNITVGDGVLVELNKTSSASVHALGGGLTINAGGVVRNTGTGGDQIYNNLAVTVNGTGVYDLNGRAEAVNGLNGGGIVDNTAAGATTITVGEANGSSTFTGTMQNTGGALSLVKTGTGELQLNNTGAGSTRTGTTTVNNGSLRFRNDANLGASAGTLYINGGTIGQISGVSLTIPSTRPVEIGPGEGRVRVAFNNSDVTINSAITGTGALRVVNDSPNRGLYLGNSGNSYSGNTIVGGNSSVNGWNGASAVANLILNDHNVIPNGAGKGNLVFDAGLEGADVQDAVLNMNGKNETVNGLTKTANGNAFIQNQLAATTSTLTVGDNNATSSFGGVIRNNGGTGGTVALTKIGNGTLTLSGANAYTGATTISAGTLRLQGTAFSTAARSYSIASGAVLNIDGGSGVATGTSAISGDGILRITGGTLNNGVGAGRNITLSLGAPGQIDIQSGAGMMNGGWQNITWTANLADLNVDGTFDAWDGQLVKVDALTGSGSIVKGINGGAQNVEVGVNNGSGTFSGTINAANPGGATFSLVKSGTGTQTLAGTTDNNALKAIVNAGTLVLAKASSPTVHALGTSGTGLTINSGGTVQLAGTGGDQIYTEVDTVVNAGGVLDLNGRSEGFDGITGGGTIRNTAPATTSTLTFGEFNSSTVFSGVIENGGGVTAITKTGSGQMNLSGNNSHSGLTTVNAGILAAFSNTALGSSAGGSVVNNGGTLQLEGGVTIAAEAATITGNGHTGTRGALASWSGVNAWNGPVTLAGNSMIFVNSDSLTIGGAVGGSGALTKTGAGTLNLTNPANTITGATAINGGVAVVNTGNEQTFGANPVSFNPNQLSLNGGTLQITTASLTINDPNRGVSVGTGGGTFNVGTGLTLNLANQFNANGVGSTFTKTGAGTFNLTGNAAVNAYVVNEAFAVQSSGVTRVLTTTTGLEIRNGATYVLAGGTLKTDRVNVISGGAFTWGDGTLTHQSTNGNAGTTDYSSSGFHGVRAGVTASFTGNLTSSANSVLALHGSPTLYLNNQTRFNNWAITGDLDLGATGDTLEFDLNPYLLRPFAAQGYYATETGSLPLITWTGSFVTPGATFENVTGINLAQGPGFAESAFSVSDPTSLNLDTWYIEYDESAKTIWFHYKVSGYVPEPASFGMLALGAGSLRFLRTLRNRRRMIDLGAA